LPIRAAVQLACFDLDNTLLATDSDYEWGQFLIELGIRDRDGHEAANDRFYADYKAGTLDIDAFLTYQLAPLAEHTPAQLDAWHREFMRQRILPHIGRSARKLVQQHREAGHTLVIVTATNAFVTAPIAIEFGIEHLIATEPERIDGRYTGRYAGTPSFREGKVTRLQEWLSGRGQSLESLAESWFYSDSRNDLPLLERVTHPVAVDPDPALEAVAHQRRWPVISLR
jgi:HAD superfamily hydrolase (TIGR01490 family)